MGKFKQMLIDDEMTSVQSARRFRAIMAILEADEDLKRKVLPYSDFALEEIDWGDMYDVGFTLEQLAALYWAKAIWHDQVTTSLDPFDMAYVMAPAMQNAVLKALAIRWGHDDEFYDEAV